MKRSNAILFMTLAVAGLCTAQAAPLYKWVDSQGRVTYHDQPPPEGSGYRVEQKRLGSGARGAVDESLEKIVEQYPVVLYSVPVCGSCDLARIYLEKRRIPFTEKNVESDPVLQEELRKKSGSLTAPTILVGAKVMNGYVESILAGELDAAGYPGPGGAGPARQADDNEENKEEQTE